jgi:ribosomal protein L37AE/L43A
MGVILKARCQSCNYDAVARLQTGIHTDTVPSVSWPHACLNCANVVTADLKSNHPRCPDCKSSSVVAYEAVSAQKIVSHEAACLKAHTGLLTKRHFCPRCNLAQLKFVDVGLWD